MQAERIGSHVVIGDNVTFGKGVIIGNNVTIYESTQFGDGVIIQDNVVIGKQPTRAKNSILKGEKRHLPAVIDSNCVIGTSSIIYGGAHLESNVYIADLATVRDNVTVGENTIVGRGVTIENHSSVGSNCKLETNCYITAYSRLGNHVFIAPCVVTTNDNYMGRSVERFDKIKGITVKDGGRVGANSTVLPGITIEEDGAVGAGSVVTKDVDKEQLVVGSPARAVRSVPEKQLLRNQ